MLILLQLLANLTWIKISYAASKKIHNINNNIIHISILDTGFCLKKDMHQLNQAINKKIFIMPPFNATGGASQYCSSNLLQENTNKNKRLSGQRVLNILLKSIGEIKNANIIIKIYPITIFGISGGQSSEYVKMAMNYIKKIDRTKRPQQSLILYAGGLQINDQQMKLEAFPIENLIFTAAGHIGKEIKRSTILWPHLRAPHQKILIIGSYFASYTNDKNHYDKNLLYQNKINFYFPDHADDQYSKKNSLSGSKRAVAIALGKMINYCQLKIAKANQRMDKLFIKTCLQNKQKNVFIKEHIPLLTF